MSYYTELHISDRESLTNQLVNDAKLERKAAKLVMASLEASEEQVNLAQALFGHKAATGVATDARYSFFPFCWDRTYSALLQMQLADRRAEFEFQQFRFDKQNLHGRRSDDLVAHKRALEPQLKRSFDAYLAKFTAMRTDADFFIVANVIGISLSADVKSGPQPKRRISKDRPQLEPTIKIQPGSDTRHLAICAAEFWTPRSSAGPSELSAEQETNLLVYRGLLRTERVCFGYGLGKKLMKRIVQQIVARAAADDALERSPLQPEGIASFLASLPIDEDGTTATLPPIKLP